MAFAQGSRTNLSYIVESTYGTTPAGNFTKLPINTHSLNMNKTRVQGNEIQSDRMLRSDRHGNRTSDGDIVCDLRADAFDDLFESLMFNSWDTTPVSSPDQLKVGTTIKSFTIEDHMADIDQARLFTGMVVNSLALSVQPDQMVQATWNFLGSDSSISQTEKTLNSEIVTQPFDSHSGAIRVADSGSTPVAVANISSLELTITNNLSSAFIIGSETAPCLEYGRCEVDGTLVAYFEDEVLYNRYVNETETAFDIALDDPTGVNEYKFFFPRAKFNTGSAPLENPQSRLLTIQFSAIYDTTEDSNIVIYRPETA